MKPYDSFHVYTDASFDKKSGLAIIGYGVFESTKEHENLHLSEIKLNIQEIKEENNIRAEILATLTALRSLATNKNVTVYTDCQTTSGLISRREKLEKNNFISQSKKQVLANADLYQEFYKLYDKILPKIVWVKGHSNDKTTRIQKNFSYLDKEVRRRLRGKT